MKKLTNPLVSVIIPVYNAGSTLSIALNSLARQTYTNLEIVVVNDASTDNSEDLIKYFTGIFEKRGIAAKALNHSQNQGVSTSRNTGLESASGDYIGYLDADDWMEPNAIELMVNEAIQKDADIVGCNWLLSFEQKERKMSQPSFASPQEAIQKIINGTLRWNLWLFLVRRSLYLNSNIRFIPGMNIGEDLRVMVKLLLEASRVCYIDKALYHYGQSNLQSLTKTFSCEHIRQITANVKDVEENVRKSSIASEIKESLPFLKQHIKLPLLISDHEEMYRTWLKWFPEVNRIVMSNGALPLRNRILQWLAVKEQFWAIKLYYRGVVRLVYGKIYK